MEGWGLGGKENDEQLLCRSCAAKPLQLYMLLHQHSVEYTGHTDTLVGTLAYADVKKRLNTTKHTSACVL